MPRHHKLDSIDLLMLDILQNDGRCTNAVLAQRVSLSESACSQRLRRLEKARIIKNYRAIIADDAITASITILAQVKLEVSAPAQLKAFERLIAAIPEVVECDLVTGEFDYLLRLVAPDMPSYMEVVQRSVQQFKGIRTWVSNVVLRRAKDKPLAISYIAQRAQKIPARMS